MSTEISQLQNTLFKTLFFDTALWSVSPPINRNNRVPLDKNSVLPTYELAEAYASNNELAVNDALLNAGFGKNFESQGFLNKSYDTESERNEAKKIAIRNLKTCRFNCNAHPGQIIAVCDDSNPDDIINDVYMIRSDSTLQKLVTVEELQKAIVESAHTTSKVVYSVDLEHSTYVEQEGQESQQAQDNVIYYVLTYNAGTPDDRTDDTYSQYMMIGGQLTAIGSTAIKLTDFYTKLEIDNLLQNVKINLDPQSKADLENVNEGTYAVTELTVDATGRTISVEYGVVATLNDVKSTLQDIIVTEDEELVPEDHKETKNTGDELDSQDGTLNLVSVLRALTVDPNNKRTLVEDRIQVPTVSYVKKLIKTTASGGVEWQDLANLVSSEPAQE